MNMPWRKRIRSPEDVQGLAARVDVLEAENVTLKANNVTLANALLDLYYDKRLVLAANRLDAVVKSYDDNDQPTGWGAFVHDDTAPNGSKWIPGPEHIQDLDDNHIPPTEAHIGALEALTP